MANRAAILSRATNIFTNSFETADFTRWTTTATDSGDLSVSTDAAIIGTYGMQALIDDATAIYAQYTLPSTTKQFRCRFYFDPNGLTMASGDNFVLFLALSTTGSAYQIQLNHDGSNYQVRGSIITDAEGTAATAYINITDASHYIETFWGASSADGANDGFLSLWVDGVAAATQQTGIDNDTKVVSSFRLGAVAGLDAGTSGTCYFDAFTSRRSSTTIGA